MRIFFYSTICYNHIISYNINLSLNLLKNNKIFTITIADMIKANVVIQFMDRNVRSNIIFVHL